MKDQAERLRELVSNSKYKNLSNKLRKRTSSTRVLTITSGKGGVGKTNFTINLAISLSNLGYKVIIFDADIGLANVDIALGIVPKYTIADILYNGKEIVEILEKGPNDIKIISGGSGIRELMDLDQSKLEKLSYELSKLESLADFILIDTGAGVSNTVLSFVNAANEVILVTTPEPTSLTDAYVMLKALSVNGNKKKLHVVINKVEDNKEANEVYLKLNKVVDRFLKVKIEHLGFIYASKLVTDSIMNQKPYTLMYPNSKITSKINGIAMKLLGKDSVNQDGAGVKGFLNRLRTIITKEGKI